MTRELMIKILMNDHCTENEAKKHLDDGTMIYIESDMTDYIFNLVNSGWEAEEAMDSWEKLTKVKLDGITYRVDYVL